MITWLRQLVVTIVILCLLCQICQQTNKQTHKWKKKTCCGFVGVTVCFEPFLCQLQLFLASCCDCEVRVNLAEGQLCHSSCWFSNLHEDKLRRVAAGDIFMYHKTITSGASLFFYCLQGSKMSTSPLWSFENEALHSRGHLADVKLGTRCPPMESKRCDAVVPAHISTLKAEKQEGCTHGTGMCLCLGLLCVSQSLCWLRSKQKIHGPASRDWRFVGLTYIWWEASLTDFILLLQLNKCLCNPVLQSKLLKIVQNASALPYQD